jgi:ribonuclease T1
MKGNTLNDWKKSKEMRPQCHRIIDGRGWMRGASAVLLALSLLLVIGLASARSSATEAAPVVRAGDLPREARETLVLIKKGGPFPYPRDGVAFANREGRLPHAARGTYREYTVPTPGHRDRGARRIIAAGTSQFWYSTDHYRSFRQIVE